MSARLDPSTPSTSGNSAITDICRLFLANRSDTWQPAATWVRALTALGLSAAGARTSLHRMTRDGYLEHDKRGSTAGYAMSAAWQHLVGDLQHLQPELTSGWLLVTFTVPEHRRDDRRHLRTVLTRQGFGNLGGGTWIGSGRKAARVRSLLRTLELDDYVELFAAEHLGPHSTEDLATRCWDLTAIAADYRTLAGALVRPVGDDPRDAFVHLVSTESAHRLLQERDPELPAEALPPDWPAPGVHDLMHQALTRHGDAAQRFLDAAWV